jgi:hypothetical protein
MLNVPHVSSTRPFVQTVVAQPPFLLCHAKTVPCIVVIASRVNVLRVHVVMIPAAMVTVAEIVRSAEIAGNLNRQMH